MGLFCFSRYFVYIHLSGGSGSGSGSGGGNTYPPGSGGGGGGGGTPSSTPLLDQLLKPGSNLSPAEKVALEEKLKEMVKSCLGKAVHKYLADHNIKLKFTKDATASYQAQFNTENMEITYQNPITVGDYNFAEEFFHVYQNAALPGGAAANSGALANMEFEAKVYADINMFMGGTGTGYALPTNQGYKNWISSLTSTGTKVPTSFSAADNTNFQSYLTLWKPGAPTPYNSAARSTTYNAPIITAIANASNCSK